MEPKQNQYLAVGVTGDRSKIQCWKEQYCIGTWNGRSMHQGKLEVVKQEMARVNIDILGISELKWIGMGGFNSDDHYIYLYSYIYLCLLIFFPFLRERIPQRRWSSHHSQQKSPMQYLDAISKTTE